MTGMLRLPEAPRVHREALARLYDTRNWGQVWRALPHRASYWTTMGKLEPAAVLFGHLDAHRYLLADQDQQVRSASLETVRATAGADRATARGAGMDRDQIVAYVLAELETKM